MTRVHTPHDGARARRITVPVEITTEPLTDDEADAAAQHAVGAMARLLPSSSSGDIRAAHIDNPTIEDLIGDLQ